MSSLRPQRPLRLKAVLLYTNFAMRLPRRLCCALVLLVWIPAALGSAYKGRPKLVVVIVIDQFRADYLERFRDQLGEGGFRLFLDRGAYFTDCNYDYANTRTGPGHATLFTGGYADSHGIVANEWWDPQRKKMVTSVEDADTRLIGVNGGTGASPHNLMSDTLGDELKLATGGKSRVFGVSLKDRAAILPAGFSGDAYWIDGKSGYWITSTYYHQVLPQWVDNFNASKRAEKYWNREWKDTNGKVLASTAVRKAKDGTSAGFYEVIGPTPFANDYEFEFAKELVVYEKLGTGPATDLLSISLSANDALGHRVGPDSPLVHSMVLETDRQLKQFFDFLGHEIGLANVWIALSADHGVAPLPEYAKSLRLPAAGLDADTLKEQINAALSRKYSRKAGYVQEMDFPLAWLNEEAFAGAGRKENEAEIDAGEAMKQAGFTAYFTKSQLARGETPQTVWGRRFAHSYSPLGGWYVMGVPLPFQVGTTNGTDHASPFSYDTHVPLAFYGLAFQPGVYRTHAETVDMAVTLASLLGINPPTNATGRVLTEAIAPARRSSNPPSGENP